MVDVPASVNISTCAEAMSRLQRFAAQRPDTKHWRWILFDRDLKPGVKAVRGSVEPVVSLGLPWLSAECSLRWIGSRCFFWPQGIPQQRRVSIISSRLKQRLDEESWWFDLLRTAILRSDPTSDLLCAVAGTAAHRYVRRASSLFGRSVLDFHVDSQDQSVDFDNIAAWITNIAGRSGWDSGVRVTESDHVGVPRVLEDCTSGSVWSVFVSPPLIGDNSNADADPSTQNFPLDRPVVDRILFAAGDCLQVLQMRAGGSIEALLTHHVKDNQRRKSLVMLASDAAGHIPALVPEASGSVIPWLLKLPPDVQPRSEADCSADGIKSETPSSLPGSTPLSHPADWLLHWTRSTVGPWPDQDEQEFTDQLILGCRAADRSVLATLLRIVTAGRLRASPEAIRGGFRVVSFTEVPLHEFRRRRAYRRHRRRYDFEPWGIAVRRNLLESRGARPVQYGDDETWRTTPETARPFFQNAGTGDGWIKDEREWRIVDHLLLNELPEAAVAVFVDTEAAQIVVQAHTRWPVIVVPE